jgi:hypothetical protein
MTRLFLWDHLRARPEAAGVASGAASRGILGRLAGGGFGRAWPARSPALLRSNEPYGFRAGWRRRSVPPSGAVRDSRRLH